jgi:hypothetical protein
MQFAELTQEQKNIVWRYAHCAALWRRDRGRNFASLEYDLATGYEIVADGLLIDAKPDFPVILGDAKDPEFFAAIFKNNDAAIPNMRATDLERLRHFIIDGEGELPMPPARLTQSAAG